MLSLAGLSMPGFWLGLLLIYLFAVNLHWFPVLGVDVPEGDGPALGHARHHRLGGARAHRPLEHARSAERGLRAHRASEGAEREHSGHSQHAWNNALIPIVTIIGLQFGGLLSGAFVIEYVFAWHGVGELAVQALQKRDFPLIQGIILVVSTTYVLVNLLVDVLYARIDPRIAYR